MKDWEKYLAERADTELWGLILLDFYWVEKKLGKIADTKAFLESTLPKIPLKMDIVMFHKVLLNVCVQLLGEDFKGTIELSISFLQRVSTKLSKETFEAVLQQYDVFGQRKRFLDAVSGVTRLEHLTDADREEQPGNSFHHSAARRGNGEGDRAVQVGSLNDLLQQGLNRIAAELKGEGGSKEGRYGDESFKASARGKAIGLLQRVPEPLAKSSAIYVSIGGADGEELFTIFSQTGARYGVLLEWNDESVDKAKDVARACGYDLRTYTGDLMQKLDDAMEYANKVRDERKVEYIVVSAQAVLHELFTRSIVAFDLQSYFAKLTLADVIIGREPILPFDWPNDVIIAGDFDANRLYRFAEVVRDKILRNDKLDLHTLSQKSLRINRSLCMETLTKAFYSKDIMYELGEYTTRISPEDLTRAMMACLSDTHDIRKELLTSDSIRKFWGEFKIEVKTVDKLEPLGVPMSHMWYVATRKGLR